MGRVVNGYSSSSVNFPIFFTMNEANNETIWNDKISQYGILYSIGTVFWAFASWIIIFILMALGIDTIRSRDTHA